MTSREEALRALEKVVELIAKATPDWRGSRNGNIVGGEFQQYAKGSAQSQVAMFCCVTSADDPGEAQLNNAAAALAAVNFIREHGSAILATASEQAPVADGEDVMWRCHMAEHPEVVEWSKWAPTAPGWVGRPYYTSPAHTSEARDADFVERLAREYSLLRGWSLDDWNNPSIKNRSDIIADMQMAYDAAMRQEAGSRE